MSRRSFPILGAFLLLCVLATLRTEVLGQSLLEAGALNRSLLWAGEYWRALFTIFIHGGLIHLVLNGIALFVLGRVVILACGARVFTLFTFLGAQAGLAASMLWPESLDLFRVGISGGVTALVGLVLAIEWTLAEGWRAYFKRRNVRVIGFLVLLNAALAVAVEIWVPGVRVDHAAHLGGLTYGVVAGLAWFTKRGPRPRRGWAVCLVLALAPALYAAYPYWNVDFFLFRGQRAFRSSHPKEAEAAYARVLELDPGHPIAGARLAWIREDPGLLEGLQPRDRKSRILLVETHLDFAQQSVLTDAAQALRLAKAAFAIERGGPMERGRWTRWFYEGILAEGAAQPVIAEFYFDAAEELLTPEDRRNVAWWRLAERLLGKAARGFTEQGLDLEERTARAREAIEMALAASAGLGENSGLDREAASRLEAEVAGFAVTLARWARTLEDTEHPPAALEDLYGNLTTLYFRLAENGAPGRRIPTYRFRAARIAERRLGLLEAPPPEECERVEGLYRAAYAEAREWNHPVIIAQAGHWLRARGIEPPEPEDDGDLADSGDGG